jgi:hypothetical protein
LIEALNRADDAAVGIFAIVTWFTDGVSH